MATPPSAPQLSALARSLAARLPRDEALASLLEVIAACYPGLSRTAVFLSEAGRLVAASNAFDHGLLPDHSLADAPADVQPDHEDRLLLQALTSDRDGPGYWAIEVHAELPGTDILASLRELVGQVFESQYDDAAETEQRQNRRIERLERDQALMQSLLAQIDTLILAEDEQHMLDVVCTQLVETGIFLSAWVAPADHGIEPIATGGDSELINHPDDCLLYTSPSPRDRTRSRMPSSA